MSNFSKKLNDYRIDNWQSNFQYINWTNVSASLRSILTAKEDKKIYDRLGNHVSSVKPATALSLDETIFRIAVLLDTQIEDFASRTITAGDYEADRNKSKAFAHPKKDGK